MKALTPPPQPQLDWAWFLDLDGTLLDLAPTPHAVVVPESLVHTLSLLRSTAHGALAVVSGRLVQQVRDLLEPLRPAAAGLHGLELVTPDGLRHGPKRPLPPVGNLRRQLQDVVNQFPRTELENKGAALAVHFRQAPDAGPRMFPAIHAIAERNRGFDLLEGKMIYEFRPAGIDKGLAVREFMAIDPFKGRKPVFVGDDRTDEDGFRAVRDMGGVAIRIGEPEGQTQAEYAIESPAALRLWLAEAAESLKRLK